MKNSKLQTPNPKQFSMFKFQNSNKSFVGFIWCLVLGICFFYTPVFASELPDLSKTDVRVRVNPKTGKAFVSLVDPINPDGRKIFYGNQTAYSAPDYRMLDPNIKSGQIPYDGPYRSNKKVYLFAATMATAGVLAGTLIPVTAATGAAAGSAAGYTAGGAAVAAGTASAAWLASRPDPHKDDYIHETRATVKPLNEKFKSQNPNSND